MPRRNLMAPAARRPASFRTPAVVQQLVHRPCQPVQRVSRHQTEMFITVCILDNRQLCSGNSRSFTQGAVYRSDENTSEIQSRKRISYAVFCLKKQKKYTKLQQ